MSGGSYDSCETQGVENHVGLNGTPDVPGVEIEELQEQGKEKQTANPRRIKVDYAEYKCAQKHRLDRAAGKQNAVKQTPENNLFTHGGENNRGYADQDDCQGRRIFQDSGQGLFIADGKPQNFEKFNTPVLADKGNEQGQQHRRRDFEAAALCHLFERTASGDFSGREKESAEKEQKGAPGGNGQLQNL